MKLLLAFLLIAFCLWLSYYTYAKRRKYFAIPSKPPHAARKQMPPAVDAGREQEAAIRSIAISGARPGAGGSFSPQGSKEVRLDITIDDD
ncbi:hypothetical protein [Desulforamulus hydrothermalis]|uniref:hypothetical protein n=1 Tax=Desulforamulus hydrothermalis TaxID=412895 RepID=UPI000310C6C7|nr:hypothetical protein [Desulforamulus hydrothermalis]SHH02413.1 hypothetical protein SAMN02745177_01177 [Desulforamulus hydrothermalis Lam5 = DSM 18033]